MRFQQFGTNATFLPKTISSEHNPYRSLIYNILKQVTVIIN